MPKLLALMVQLPRRRHTCHLPNRRVAHLRIRIAIAFKSIYFLLTLILMAVCSLREFYGLTCWGAKPPLVAVVHFAEDDELQVTTCRHPNPSSWAAFRFIDYPTRSAAGSKHALILRALCSANFVLKTRSAIPTMGARVRRYPSGMGFLANRTGCQVTPRSGSKRAPCNTRAQMRQPNAAVDATVRAMF